MKSIAAAGLLLIVSNAFGQTPVKDPDVLRTLLVEVHQLRQNIEAMTAASQRVQIALYGLQMQDGAVARAMQRAETTRNKCSSIEMDRQHFGSEIQRMESSLPNGFAGEAANVGEKAIKERLADLKSGLEARTVEAQNCQAAEVEASSQLQKDQAKLAEMQERIERLDQTLEKLTTSAK